MKPVRLGWGFWVAVGWLGIVVLAAIFADFLPIPDPKAFATAPPNLGPSIHHLLGTDNGGGDVFSQLIFGSRVSIVVGLGSIAIGIVFGGGFGIIAGYYGKSVDFVSNSVAIIVLSFPPLILVMGLISFAGRKLFVITLAIGIVAMPLIFRIVRTSTQSFVQREFVLAAKAMGAPTHRIIIREIIPNVAMTALAFIFIAVGVAIVSESALSFLGLSVPPPTPTWGNMINVGTSVLETNSILWIWPSLALFFTVLSLNLTGDKLRKKFGVKESIL